MGVEVAEHGIALPSTDDADFIRIHTAKEEGHCATGAKRAGCNVVGINPSMTRDGQGSSTQETRDHGAGYRPFSTGIVIIDVERGRGTSIVATKMKDTASDGTNGTSGALTVGSMRHDLAFDSVFLSGEGEGAVSGGLQLRHGATEDVGDVEGTDFHLNIFEAEGMFSIPGSVSILAWAK